MRPCVQRFLAAAAGCLELDGPVALLRCGNRNRGAAAWMRHTFAGQLMLDCRVAHHGAKDEEIEIDSLPIEAESLQTLLCLDLLRRYDETADLLRMVRPLLAPGGIAIFTADVSGARPHAGLSRVLTPLGLDQLAGEFEAAVVGWQGDVDFPSSLFLVACESPVVADFAARAGRFIDAFQRGAATRRSAAALATRMWNSVRNLPARLRGSAVAQSSCQSVSLLLHLPKDADWKESLFDAPLPATKRLPHSRIDVRSSSK